MSQAYLSNRAIRIEIRVIDDASILDVHVLLVCRFLVVKVAVELVHLFDKLFIVDHCLLSLLMHPLFVLKELTVRVGAAFLV